MTLLRAGPTASALLIVSACGIIQVHRQADVVPLNPAAIALGIPRMEAVLYGTGYGPVTVTMPNGEILTGHHRPAVGGTVTTGVGSAYNARGMSVATETAVSTPMNNPFTAQATGERGTIMMCQGSGGEGHGDAVCTMNGGAQYQVMF